MPQGFRAHKTSPIHEENVLKKKVDVNNEANLQNITTKRKNHNCIYKYTVV